MEVKSIVGSSFGAELHGLDLLSDVSDETIAFVLGTLFDHRVVVIKNQHLDEEAYLAFGRKLGTPVAHPLEHLRLAGFPEIEAIGNTQERDKDASVRNGAAFWHTDQCYEANPASIISLYARRTPCQGGETLISDLRAAYDDLDQDTKDQIDQLVVHHNYSAGGDGYGETSAPPIKTSDQADRLRPVRHRLVMQHPSTRQKSLYAVTGFATGIEGMTENESAHLLQSLKDHVLKPGYQFTHRHVTGDITLIDLFQTLHSAVPVEFSTSQADARLLWRLGIKNSPDALKNTWKLDLPPDSAT